MSIDVISIRGASRHNLKNVDLEIPRDKLVVITGPSGSGKSTLAFDTIYAEGQRRYVESLSAYARQFLERMEKPEVESIEGLSPAIAIEQKTSSRNPRSTVGTVTEIYDYLRLLFARVGEPHCHKCGKPITAQPVDQIVDRILDLPEGERVQILGPVVRGRKGEHKKLLARLGREGYVRARIDGEIHELDEQIDLDRHKKHDIEVVVDRLVVKEGIRPRLVDSVETASALGEGLVLLWRAKGAPVLFSRKLSCPDCGTDLPELAPRMFSFNSPHGACPQCDGLGTTREVSEAKVIPDPYLSLAEGAIAISGHGPGTWVHEIHKKLLKRGRYSINTPFADLPPELRDVILNGTGEKKVDLDLQRGESRFSFKMRYEGILATLKRRLHETKSTTMREYYMKFLSAEVCPACRGRRIRPESLAVLIDSRNIHDFTSLPISVAAKNIRELKLNGRQEAIAGRILKEIRSRLGFLEDVGLNYLDLNRTASTLSGGEAQRIRLATQIGSSLTGVLYVLDEPSIGLHQRDNGRLLNSLKRIRDLGNSVLVVEHDEETILSADHLVDLGPAAGIHGGEIVAEGTPEDVMRSKASLTGRYLRRELRIEIPEERRKARRPTLKVHGAKHHNLKNIDLSIPLGLFTCVTGVSGSGKSSLINETLYPALARSLHRAEATPGDHRKISGIQHLDKVIDIDQAPIGRSPRSNPATYTGLFTHIRDLFTGVPESRLRGYKPGRFSFNVKGGRCEACQGDGILRIEMHFLPDVYVTCDSCKGRRYNRATLEIRYRGATIADVLDMTVEQAMDFLGAIPAIKAKCKTLSDVGLGYLRLGQPATTLSGGEAQRIKLSRELSRRATGRTLYLLDEPTTGLHFDDVKKLLHVLNRLAETGNTVVVIEHNLEVIKTADWIIDLGPEGGEGGGHIVATGTPEEVSRDSSSYTGLYLKELFARERSRRTHPSRTKTR